MNAFKTNKLNQNTLKPNHALQESVPEESTGDMWLLLRAI